MAGQASIGTTIAGVGLTIGHVVYINGPGITGSTVDITPIGSNLRYKRPGIIDLGSITIGLRYEVVNSASLLSELISISTLRVFNIVYPDKTYFQFSGFVNGYNTNVPEDGAIDAEITIELSGDTNPFISI